MKILTDNFNGYTIALEKINSSILGVNVYKYFVVPNDSHLKECFLKSRWMESEYDYQVWLEISNLERKPSATISVGRNIFKQPIISWVLLDFLKRKKVKYIKTETIPRYYKFDGDIKTYQSLGFRDTININSPYPDPNLYRMLVVFVNKLFKSKLHENTHI